MTKTNNYQLNQWEATDKLSREDFNADNAAIDAAIKAVADTAGSKASAEELAAVSQSVAALSTALGSGGQTCRIAYGSYTGTSTYGSSDKKTLTFDFMPVAVLICMINGGHWYESWLVRPQTYTTSIGGECMDLIWSNTGVSWYGNSASGQNNSNGSTYNWVAIGVSA